MYRVIVVLLVTGVLGLVNGVSADEVNVYSARKENLIKPLLDRFTEQTGIHRQSRDRQSRRAAAATDGGRSQ